MSTWSAFDIEAKILAALGDLHLGPTHHFGRPWMTAYQLAIKVDAAHPDLRHRLGRPVGGAGTEKSLAQYFANELSRRIKANGENYPVEGAFLTNEHVVALSYETVDGTQIISSLTGSGYDLSLFRLRKP